MKYLHISCHESYGVFKKSTLPKWKIFFYAMRNIYLHDGKSFLGTRWKIFYTMKIFFYMINFFVNYNIENLIKKIKIFFLHDAIFYGMKKFFHAIKIWFPHDQNIFSTRWKTFSLYSEKNLCKMKIFLNDEKTVSHDQIFSMRWKRFFYTMRNFFFPINIFLHHEDYFFQTMKNISFIWWKYFLHEEK